MKMKTKITNNILVLIISVTVITMLAAAFVISDTQSKTCISCKRAQPPENAVQIDNMDE